MVIQILLVGGRGGTPLHHAAKRGLEPTVRLLLSCGGMVIGPGPCILQNFARQCVTICTNED